VPSACTFLCAQHFKILIKVARIVFLKDRNVGPRQRFNNFSSFTEHAMSNRK